MHMHLRCHSKRGHKKVRHNQNEDIFVKLGQNPGSRFVWQLQFSEGRGYRGGMGHILPQALMV